MSDEITFTVFCLEWYKVYRQLSGKEVIKLFSAYSVFDYIKEFYDILHLYGHNYIVRDIDIYLKARGVIFAD